MTFLSTCCWTDHSKGCPAENVKMQPDRTQWLREFIAEKVRLGYMEPMAVDALEDYLERSTRRAGAA